MRLRVRGVIMMIMICCFISCDRESQQILPTERAADIFIDITLADQIINLHTPDKRDSIRGVLTESLLKIHKISQEELDANLYLYMSDFDNFNTLTDEMMKRYDGLKKKFQQ